MPMAAWTATQRDARRRSRSSSASSSRRSSCSAARSSRSAAAAGPPADRLAHAALPRRGADARAGAGRADRARRRWLVHLGYLVAMVIDRHAARSAHVPERGWWSSHGQRLARSVTPHPAVRQPPLGAHPRAQPAHLQARLDRHLHRLLRAGVLSCWASALGWAALIGTVTGPDGQQIPYAVFVAPALLATSAMNGASTTRPTCSSGCATRRPTTACWPHR